MLTGLSNETLQKVDKELEYFISTQMTLTSNIKKLGEVCDRVKYIRAALVEIDVRLL